MKTALSFPSRGAICAADLYLPDTDFGTPRAGLILGHGFGGTKDGLEGQSQYFASAGYAVLTIDYRFFGQSEGEPRGQLFPLEEVEDMRNAITYLQKRPEVDPNRIGIWGTSFGGGVVIYVASVDRRVKVVVSQAPIVNGRTWMKSLRAEGEWDALLDRLDADRAGRYETGVSARIPLGGPSLDAAMPTSDSEQLRIERAGDTPIGRYTRMVAEHSPRLQLTLESIERIIEFMPDQFIHLIGPRPLRIITPALRDVVHPLDQIYQAFRRANEPKDLVLLPVEQYDIYAEGGIETANASALEWFDRYLQ